MTANVDLGHGQHGGPLPSRALYLTDAGPIVRAAFLRSARKIDRSDGTRHRGDLSFVVHATRWRIEVEDGTGSFTPLREFTT